MNQRQTAPFHEAHRPRGTYGTFVAGAVSIAHPAALFALMAFGCSPPLDGDSGGDSGPQNQSGTSTVKFTQLSASGSYTCGLKLDGTVTCWGTFVANQVPPPGLELRSIAVGRQSYGIDTSGSILCWGYDNSLGQCSPPEGDFIQVSNGGAFACAVRDGGSVDCWGGDNCGQTAAPDGVFKFVAAGQYHACGLKTDGAVVCWGAGAGTCEYLDEGQSSAPAGEYTQLSVGDSHSCVVSAWGGIGCWGAILLPAELIGVYGFAQVEVQGKIHCVIRLDGSIECWGYEPSDQDLYHCDYVDGPPDGEFTQVTSAGSHACALDTDGYAHCWGLNCVGEAWPP